MKLLARLKAWLKVRRTPLSALMKVETSAEGVRVSVVPPMDAAWNQEFAWKDIVRVCFKDEGIYRSDIVFLEARGREKPFMILTEATGGNEFMGQLAESGLFPMEILRKAIGSSNGGSYCWPPKDAKS